MPVKRSDYQRLAQSVEDDLEQGDVGLHQSQPTSPISAVGTHGIRPQIDLRTIDTAFKKWTENIAQKVKRKKASLLIYPSTCIISRESRRRPRWRSERLCTLSLVRKCSPLIITLGRYEIISIAKPFINKYRKLKTLDHKAPMSHDEYASCVPKLIACSVY
jgi:hypothetical protein